MQTTNPRDYIELLQFFKIALSTGIMQKQRIVEWADEIIRKDSEPDYFIIELSLCGQQSINDIVSFINAYIGPNEPEISSRIMFGFMYHQYIAQQLSLDKIMVTIWWILQNNKLTKGEEGCIYRLDEVHYFAQEGLSGALEAVEKQILQFIEIYKDFRINNSKEWKEIDETIDEKVQHLLAKVEQEQIHLIHSTNIANQKVQHSPTIVEQEQVEIIEIQEPQTKRKWWKLW